MNTFIENANHWGEVAVRFGMPMLWQSSLLMLVVLGLDLLLRRKARATVRYALWLVVLLKLVLPPSLALPTSLAWWVLPTEVVEPARKQFVVTYSQMETAPIETELVDEPLPALPPPQLSGAAWVLLTAASSTTLLLTWMLVRCRQVSRMVSSGKPAPAWLEEQFTDTRHHLGLRGKVGLCLTGRPMSPAVCGLWCPVVVLPASLVESLSPAQLRAVLLHELIHLRRGDVWMNCLQALLQTVYWWHPLLWFANARIRRLREEAVDDAVMLALSDEAETYAPTLLEVAKLAFQRPASALGFVGIMESRSALRQRIERLLNFKAPRKAGVSFAMLLGVSAFAALAVPMGEAPRTAFADPARTDHVARVPDKTKVIDSLEAIVPPPKDVQLAQVTANNPNTPTLGVESAAPAALARGLIFDQETKELDLTAGETNAHFVFYVTNVSASTISITNIMTSCGCTVAKPPAKPWVLAPSGTGELPVVMNVAGKSGKLTKSITLFSEQGSSVLNVTVNLPADKHKTIAAKLSGITFEHFSADHETLSDLLNRLNAETKKHDASGEGINYDINPNIAATLITIQPGLNNIRLNELLNAITKASSGKIEFTIFPTRISFRQTDPPDKLLTRRFKLGTSVPTNATNFFRDLFAASGIVLQPPTATFFNTTHDELLVRAPKRDMDRITEILGQKFGHQAAGDGATAADGASASAPQGDNNKGLVTRRFKVDPNSFNKALGLPDNTLDIPSENAVAAFRKVLTKAGVTLQSETVLFYKARTGDLLARGTPAEVDLIQNFVEVLSAETPQVMIKAQFVEVTAKDPRSTGLEWWGSTPTNSAVLTDPQYRIFLRALEKRDGVDIVSGPQVLTLSGLQAQIQVVDIKTVVNGISGTVTNGHTNFVYQTGQQPFGLTLDVLPQVSADGATITMKVTPTVSEFIGYDNPKEITSKMAKVVRPPAQLPLPRYRVRQTTTTAKIFDGQTLVLMNFPDEEVTKRADGTESKTPFKDKKNRRLIVFITPTIVDQGGNRQQASTR